MDDDFRVRENIEGKREIFDPVRNEFVALTPEEEVRQCVIRYLFNVKNVPYSLMGVEKKIVVNKLTKRPDIIVFDRTGKVVMIVECKSPSIKINQRTLDQIIRYNMQLKSDYLMITNGKAVFCIDCTGSDMKFIDLDHWKYEC